MQTLIGATQRANPNPHSGWVWSASATVESMTKPKLNTEFAVETADRAIKSIAQGFIVYAGGSSAVLDAWTFDWVEALGTGLGMGVLSLATSLATGSLFKRGATTLPPPAPKG